MATHNIRRTEASLTLEGIAKEVGQILHKDPNNETARAIRSYLTEIGVTPATPCFGQQHTDKESGAFIDNCSVCGNRGWLQQTIKVK